MHLASTLHYGKTSAACHISPSALSRTVDRLEDELGRPLLLRDRRSVSLTEAGRSFRDFARETLDRYRWLRDSLTGADQQLRGEIVLYCSVTAAQAVLSDIFAAFRALHPGVHVRLQTGDAAYAVERVRDGSADLTVAAQPDRLPAGLEFRVLTTTPLVFIAPRTPCEVTDLAGRRPIPWGEVPMILAEQALSRRRAESWFRARGIRANVYAEVAGHEAILAMVRLGCGVGVVPRLVLDQSSLREEVRVLEVEPGLEPYRVGVCARRRRLEAPIVRAFWEVAEASAPAP